MYDAGGESCNANIGKDVGRLMLEESSFTRNKEENAFFSKQNS